MDNQTSVYIPIFQGERIKAKDNHWLDTFEVTVPPEPKGVPDFRVCFSIDENGILKVFAEETRSGNKNEIAISNGKGTLPKEEIERMVLEAKKYKADDEMYRKKVEAKNALEESIYKIKNTVNNETIASVLSPNDKKKIDNVIKRASSLVDMQELAKVDKYKNQKRELENIFKPISLKMNQDLKDDVRPNASFAIGACSSNKKQKGMRRISQNLR